MKIFWSWQSDTHQESARYFVRDVLRSLAGELNGASEAQEADRPADESSGEHAISVDHDTLNVGGSPEIARTILQKIRECAVFVADVTPVAFTKAGKALPNPNVMIELGYALNVLDNERIVLVMNLAEKAELKKLPFDLRHWRAPITYRVAKDTPDDQRREQADKLRAALKERIEPGLKKAAMMMREAARRTDRSPDFFVRLVEEDPQPLVISPNPRNRGASSLAEVQQKTPLLPVPSAPTQAHGLDSLGLAARFGLGRDRPVSEWTLDEVQTYNARVQAYYRDYEAFLERHDAWQRLVLRTFRVELQLENSGTASGTLVDLDLYVPEGLILHDDEDRLAKPTPPSAPEQRPISSGMGIARPISPNLAMSAFIERRPPATRVYPDEGRIHFSIDELKHHHVARLDPIMMSFTDENAIGSFEMIYDVTAREPVDPIRGTVRFEIVRSD